MTNVKPVDYFTRKHGEDQVFANGLADLSYISCPEQDMTTAIPLSKNVTKNSESPVDDGEFSKIFTELDFLDNVFYGAEETVETHVESGVPVQACGAEVTVETHVEPGIQVQVRGAEMTVGMHEALVQPSEPPVHSVKQKFHSNIQPAIILCNKENFVSSDRKTLAPRPNTSQIIGITRPEISGLQKESNSVQVTQTGEPTFTQQLDVAGQLLREIGINIRSGGKDDKLGIINIRSIDEELDSKIKKEKEKRIKPVDVFRTNEIVYGTTSALTDLVKYHDTPMLANGVHGVYTDLKYNFLGLSHRVPEESYGMELVRTLGKGAFGTVELWGVQNEKFLVKKKVLSNFSQNEVLLTSRLNHPNILKTHGFIMNQGVPEIIMNFAGESLLAYSLQKDRTENFIWEVTYFALEGLKYLHQNDIIHFDIKPENICIKEGPDGLDVTIADFGSAKRIGEGSYPRAMTHEYMSPELCQQYIQEHLPTQKYFVSDGNEAERVTGKTDIFSLGVTVMFPYEKTHTLIKHYTAGQTNYANVDNAELLRLTMIIQMAQFPNLVQGLISQKAGQNMRDLIFHLTQGDPNVRFNASEALEWMKQISKQAELAKQETKICLKKAGVKSELSRKVLQARRSSTDVKPIKEKPKGKRDTCQGVDLSRVNQEHQAILNENNQLKNRVVKGLLKRKLNVIVPASGKQLKRDTSSKNVQTFGKNEQDTKSAVPESPCNLPNFSMLNI